MVQPWKCPVCGYMAEDEDSLDKHIQETGHILYDNTEDKGNEPHEILDKPEEIDDLSYTSHSGYSPGVSSGDVTPQSDLDEKERVQGEWEEDEEE